MKTYDINFTYTAQHNVTVEAETEEQAREIAQQKFNASESNYELWGSWEIGYIDELKETIR
jgi:maltose-binding protein MalE